MNEAATPIALYQEGSSFNFKAKNRLSRGLIGLRDRRFEFSDC